MKPYRYINCFFSVLVVFLMNSCCQLCLKSFSVEPVWSPGSAGGGSTVTVKDSDLSAKGTVTFQECANPAKCEAVNALNRQMKQLNKDYEAGRITWDQYSVRTDRYLAQLKSLAQEDKNVATANIVPQTQQVKKSEFGSAPLKRFIKRSQFSTEADYQKASVAEIWSTSSAIASPASSH